MVALKLNKLIILMCSITLLIISCVSLIEFSNTANSLRTQPIAASSRSTIWSGGNGLRWVPPS